MARRPASPSAVAACALAVAMTIGSCAGRSTSDVSPSPAHPTVAAAVIDPSAAIPPSSIAPSAPPVRALGTCDPRADVSHFTLAHLNDMQARYGDLIAGRSRYGYVAGYLRALKRQAPATLVLDAGDDYEKGSLTELRTMGESTRRMIQALPIDARTIGNHDFAYGAAAVLLDVSESAHPVLAANIRRDGGASPFAPFVRIDVGCVKVGIVGLVTSNYGSDDLPSREPFDGVFQHDDHYAQILGDEVRAHRAEVDVMIALDHLGLWQDTDLARNVPGVDLFVGGHSEDVVSVPRAVQRSDGSRALVLQAGHFALTLGRADFAWRAKERALTLDRYSIVKVDASLPYADDVGDLARALERSAGSDPREIVARVGARIAAGKPMADLVWRAASDRWGADALVVGKDVFWEGLAPGPVTLQHLYDAVLVQREPAGTSGFSSLHVVSMTGVELAALRAKLAPWSPFSFYAPPSITPLRTYRVVIEKRPLEHPELAFLRGARPPPGRYAGEIIDLLEAFARARTERGRTLD